MKNHLKVILLCLGAGLGTLPALRADDTPPPPANPAPGTPDGARPDHPDREKMRERMIKHLGLTADQQTKWQSIEQQERDAIKALREDTTLPRDQKRPKMEEIRKNFEGQRRALLTPDQQTKFDEMRAKMKERMHDRQAQGQDGPPPPPPAPTDGK
jgi:Spy/CpxP family protein refolding chaperone